MRRGPGTGDRGPGTGDRGPGTGDRGPGLGARDSGFGIRDSKIGDWGPGSGFVCRKAAVIPVTAIFVRES